MRTLLAYSAHGSGRRARSQWALLLPEAFAPVGTQERSEERSVPEVVRAEQRHALGLARISLLHLRGMPWARIGEQVGQRNLAVTANTYTHVLTDETELDYAALLAS
jgi:hypothetical protein